MKLEYKEVPVGGFEVVDDEEGIVEAIVSVTGIVDKVKDVIEPGAYEKTLARQKPKGVYSHSWEKPVSRTLEAKELLPGDPDLPKNMRNGEPWPRQAGALKVKMQFNLQTQRGREAYSDVKFFGEDQEWSIGYNVPTGGATMDTKAGVRRIKTLELFEFSPVLFGAMPLAVTQSVKTAQLAYKALANEPAPGDENAPHEFIDANGDGDCDRCGEDESSHQKSESESGFSVTRLDAGGRFRFESKDAEGEESLEDLVADGFDPDPDPESDFTDEELNAEIPQDEAKALLEMVEAEEIELTVAEYKSLEALAEGKAGGADRNRGGAEKLRRYWTHGEGAAKIKWGTPGDWRRCVAQLSKYLGPRAKGYCNLRHKEVNGYYPGDDKNKSAWDGLELEGDLIVFDGETKAMALVETIEEKIGGLNDEDRELLHDAFEVVFTVLGGLGDDDESTFGTPPEAKWLPIESGDAALIPPNELALFEELRSALTKD